MGYSLMPKGSVFTASFKRIEVYEIDGVKISSPALAARRTQIGNYSVSVSAGSSLNAVCHATDGDNYVDSEAEWRKDKKCTGPVLAISIGPTRPHTGSPKFATVSADLIHTYDSFSEARYELREVSRTVVPSVFTSLSAVGFASDPNVKLTHRDVAFFGATADRITILDSYISVSATGSVLTAVSDADAEEYLELSFGLLSKIDAKMVDFLYLGLKEKHLIQRFLLMFISIERSTHMAFKRLKAKTPDVELNKLNERFEWSVQNFWKNLGANDIQTFKRLKLIRDKLAHGETTYVSEHDVVQVEALAKQVLIATTSSLHA